MTFWDTGFMGSYFNSTDDEASNLKLFLMQTSKNMTPSLNGLPYKSLSSQTKLKHYFSPCLISKLEIFKKALFEEMF